MNKQSIEDAVAKLLNKAKNQDEITEVYDITKQFCSDRLRIMQEEAEIIANKIQSTIDRMNGN